MLSPGTDPMILMVFRLVSNCRTPALPLVAGDGTVADPMISTFQIDSVAVKVNWPVTWALRSTKGAAWLTAGNW